MPHTHRVDAALSLALTAGAVAVLFCAEGRRGPVVTLLAVALSLAVLSSFSQIDSDGRYRLPAELVLLVVVPLAYGRGFLALWAWRRRQTDTPAVDRA